MIGYILYRLLIKSKLKIYKVYIKTLAIIYHNMPGEVKFVEPKTLAEDLYQYKPSVAEECGDNRIECYHKYRDALLADIKEIENKHAVKLSELTSGLCLVSYQVHCLDRFLENRKKYTDIRMAELEKLLKSHCLLNGLLRKVNTVLSQVRGG
jgi:hypothetical protein